MNRKKISARSVKKIVFCTAASAALYFSSIPVSTIYLYRHKDPDVEKYANENLERLIRNQEKKIGITYSLERPEIEYVFPEKYVFSGSAGIYDDTKNIIYLPSGLLTTPGWNPGDLMVAIATFNHTKETKRVLDHELAHFFCDSLQEQVFGKPYPPWEFRHLLSREELLADKLINEGIARYVENAMNGEEEPCSFQEWPSTIKDFSNSTIYQGGCAIVKPIIEQYGEKGIRYLLFNLPDPKEIFLPQEYQERILAILAKQ